MRLAWALLCAAGAAQGTTCAPPSAGVCHENGYPLPGVNVDDDCCAAAAGASCAPGYKYSRGAVCDRWDGGESYAVCCEPCAAGDDCDPGPGATCARPDEAVCMERGYPRIGDNVDADCCALEGKGWCAEGYGYTQGDACYKTDDWTAVSTCCQPCDNTTGYCEDGPGNDRPPPTWRKVLIFLTVVLLLCGGAVGGVVAAICCCCKTRWTRRADAGLGAPRQPSSPGYVPVEMATGVVIGADPDAGLEMNDLPGVTNPFHGDVAGI